jgi:DNA primase
VEGDCMSGIDLIKNSLNIMDVLERYAGVNFLKVKTSRQRFQIPCPYHMDKNPSFTVYADTNTFRCWSGCNDGKSGDVIDIVKLSQNIDTNEAVKTLISDYGLEKPDSVQAKKWQTKRAAQEQAAALQKRLYKKMIDSIDLLKKVEKASQDVLSIIKTTDDLERVGNLYHITTQVNYWMECFLEDNPIIKFQTLEEVNCFLNEISKRR